MTPSISTPFICFSPLPILSISRLSSLSILPFFLSFFSFQISPMPSKPVTHQTSSSSSSTSSSSSSSCSGGRDVNVNVRACTFLHAQTTFTMARNDPPGPIITFFIVFLCVITFSCASDTDTLFKFKDSLANDGALDNWNASSKPCDGDNSKWVGVLCSNGSIWGLQLENMGLMGVIDFNALMALPYLRTVSFRNNSFDGPFPNIKQLGALKSVYLSGNRYSGKIPDDTFLGMGSLKKLYLNKNRFNGRIPSSIVALPKLLELRLDDNQFDGTIPDFQQKDLKLANLSNNKFQGQVPPGLSKMGTSLFSGNDNLCGEPLDPCGSGSKSAILIIGIVIGTLVAIGFLGAIFVVLRRKNDQQLLERSPSSKMITKKVESDEEQMEHGSPGNNPNPGANKKQADQGNKLIFIREEAVRFDLQDLLRASAEVLGSGSFGSSYKAVLLSGPALVVKRFRLMNNVGREEFQEHMRRLGRLAHPNLLSIVSYYYRKEEKLLVSEFVENGSLAYQLHGNRSADRPGLDWPTRLKIIKGVAKGLAYLYNELPSLIVPHGHLKSSNVLLNESFEPLLADYALVPLINQEHATQLMVAYKSPEYTQFGRTTKKTDVWSFGILILEMITGKFPANYLQQGKGNNTNNSDLASWVNSVVREEWTGEVFDKDMKGTKNAEEEMMKLLKIGLGCCEEDVEKRWDWKEAVEKIEELKERESSSTDNEDYSSYASEGDNYSRGGMTTEDEFSFSMNS